MPAIDDLEMGALQLLSQRDALILSVENAILPCDENIDRWSILTT